MNKFYYDALQTNIESLAPLIKPLIDNLRSNLSKNALIFCKELFGEKRGYEMSEFIRQVLPVVLVKTVFEKNFIVIEAKIVMKLATQNCVFPSTIDVLVEGCMSKNGTQAELSI
jgi:hypothetical protein